LRFTMPDDRLLTSVSKRVLPKERLGAAKRATEGSTHTL